MTVTNTVPAKWRIRKHGIGWDVFKPSAAWGTKKYDGWAGYFETWDEAMQWATDAQHRLDYFDSHQTMPRPSDPAYRIMWAEGLTL